MPFENMEAIVLAAGKSTRFKTERNKLLEKICGQEIILFSTKLLEQMDIKTTIVIGYQKELIKETVKSPHQNRIDFVEQTEQLGTGHAVACAKNKCEKEHILILNGDVPLITKEIIEKLYNKHVESDSVISFVTSHYTGPDHTYGRVIFDNNGIKIVEAKDFKQNMNDLHCCINAGIYLVKKAFLEEYICKIEKSSVTNEFYLTSIIETASKSHLNVETIKAPLDKIRGVNTFEELWAAEQIKRSELIKHWMRNGVRFNVAQNIHIDIDVEIGSGTEIECGVHLIGKTTIGKNCKIRKFSSIENTILEDNVEIFPNCVIRDSRIKKESQVGPFAHIHTQTNIEKETIIGNFVEIKQSTIGKYTHAKHHAYLGNATIGSRVNIGAGTITCNHDGITKHQTTIKNNAYIGSNNTLVAPVTIEQNAFTAAGSTITENIPKNCLAIGRSRQINKEDYVQTLFEKLKQKSLKLNGKKTAPYIPATKENERDLT